MKDNYGRPVTSLRISVTNDCDLNCFYCHREGCPNGTRKMTGEELGNIVQIATEFGIKKIKLTGGEPLMRNDMEEIISAVNQAPVVDLSMATNGIDLKRRAAKLVDAGLDRVNVSLDTLDPHLYAEITGRPVLNRVLEGIDVALDVGLYPVKLNMLILKGINDGEVERLLEYSSKRATILQIIELLWTPDTTDIYDRYHLELDAFESRIREQASEVRTRWTMQARRKYLLEGGNEVEIVNPMHNSEFCTHCTRLRMTSDGYLKPCLMRNDNLVDVLTPLRYGDADEVRKSFKLAISRRKPYFKGGQPHSPGGYRKELYA